MPEIWLLGVLILLSDLWDRTVRFFTTFLTWAANTLFRNKVPVAYQPIVPDHGEERPPMPEGWEDWDEYVDVLNSPSSGH